MSIVTGKQHCPALSCLCFSIVREIVRNDKSVLNDEDENSNTALHLAAQYGHNKVAEVLLELGADVSARSVHLPHPVTEHNVHDMCRPTFTDRAACLFVEWRV